MLQRNTEEEASLDGAYACVGLLLCVLCLDADIKARINAVSQDGMIRKVVTMVESYLRLRRENDQDEDEGRTSSTERMQTALEALRSVI